MKFKIPNLFFSFLLAGFFFLQQNIAAAENVPPPPPPGNTSINTKPAVSSNQLTPPAQPPQPPVRNKKIDAQTEAATSVPPPPPLPTGKSSINLTPAPKSKLVPQTQSKKKKRSTRPEVTIVPKKLEIRAEYRFNDVLYMIKVTPKSRAGRTYYLIDQHGDGIFVRSNFKPKKSIPKWVLKRTN